MSEDAEILAFPTWRRYDAAFLTTLPTLARDQSCDLKIDTGLVRIWLSRVTRADGAPYDHRITVERLRSNHWQVADTFQG